MDKIANKEVLNNFYEEIGNNEVIPFSNAISLLMKDSSDDTLLRVFDGSLYFIYEYLNDRDYDLLDNNSFDMNDILNSILALWYDYIREGAILKCHSYAGMMQNIVKGQKLSNLLGINTDYEVGTYTSLTRNFLINALPNSFSTLDYSFARFYDEYTAYDNKPVNKNTLEMKYYRFLRIRELLMNSDFNIYNQSFIRDNINLILSYIEDHLDNEHEIPEDDSFEHVENLALDNISVENILDNPELTSLEKNLLLDYFGFNGATSTIRELEVKYDLKHATCQNRLANAIKKSRKFLNSSR